MNQYSQFRREQHNQIASVLSNLDATLLEQHGAYFGGGTAIALQHGEYRTSFDIDFLTCDWQSYSRLKRIAKRYGLIALIREDCRGALEARLTGLDDYGIRGIFTHAGQSLKFEIIYEGRIIFENQVSKNRILDIVALSETDAVAEKLLANCDRHADFGTFSRDAIDLAHMNILNLKAHPGFNKATFVYGSRIETELEKAVRALLKNRDSLGRCMSALEIEEPMAKLRSRLSKLLS